MIDPQVPVDLPAPSAAPHLNPRSVPWQHAFSWYEDALRLFKRRALVWMLLAVLTIATELAFQLLGGPWPLLGKVLAALVGCGMLYASAAADRHAPPRLSAAWRAFQLPLTAMLAIVTASLVTFAAEAFAAWWVADVNLLLLGSNDELTPAAVMGIYAIGVLASLPVTFVPLHVLFETVSATEAFAASWRAFLLNTVPLLVYAALSLVLLAVGFATMGFGLVIVLPVWAASSYVAWRDIFGVGQPPVGE